MECQSKMMTESSCLIKNSNVGKPNILFILLNEKKTILIPIKTQKIEMQED